MTLEKSRRSKNLKAPLWSDRLNVHRMTWWSLGHAMYHVEDTVTTFQNSGRDQGEKMIRFKSLICRIICHSARNFMVPGKTPDFINQMSIFYRTLQGCVTIKTIIRWNGKYMKPVLPYIDGLRHIFPFM